ncbi:MAG: histidine phosphatase family protein [Myxococcota bacterium]
MKVLVIRHSIAVDPYAAPSDELRWLTGEGRVRMREVAKAIQTRVTPTVIYTSPLTRAVQTAEILASEIQFTGAVEVHPPLSVDYGTTAQALSVLEAQDPDAVVALVSHEPKVRVLAGHLTGHDRMPSFRTGTCCCVEIDGGAHRFRWILHPDPLRFVTTL